MRHLNTFNEFQNFGARQNVASTVESDLFCLDSPNIIKFPISVLVSLCYPEQWLQAALRGCESLLVHIDIEDLRLALKYVLCGTGYVVVECFKVSYVRHVHVKLRVGLRVNVVHGQGVARE